MNNSIARQQALVHARPALSRGARAVHATRRAVRRVRREPQVVDAAPDGDPRDRAPRPQPAPDRPAPPPGRPHRRLGALHRLRRASSTASPASRLLTGHRDQTLIDSPSTPYMDTATGSGGWFAVPRRPPLPRGDRTRAGHRARAERERVDQLGDVFVDCSSASNRNAWATVTRPTPPQGIYLCSDESLARPHRHRRRRVDRSPTALGRADSPSDPRLRPRRRPLAHTTSSTRPSARGRPPSRRDGGFHALQGAGIAAARCSTRRCSPPTRRSSRGEWIRPLTGLDVGTHCTSVTRSAASRRHGGGGRRCSARTTTTSTRSSSGSTTTTNASSRTRSSSTTTRPRRRTGLTTGRAAPRRRRRRLSRRADLLPRPHRRRTVRERDRSSNSARSGTGPSSPPPRPRCTRATNSWWSRSE